MFRVGQRVVCVHQLKLRPRYPLERVPLKGQILTIRSIEPGKFQDGIFMRFEELVSPIYEYRYGLGEVQYHVKYFRPVVETDISVLRKLLAPTRELQSA